jgi:glutamate synthase domain-containing protein 1
MYTTEMCGIVGYFDRGGNVEYALGAGILKMLEALACRGPDSAGVALFGAPAQNRFRVRVKLGEDADGAADRAVRIAAAIEPFGPGDLIEDGAYLRFSIRDSSDLRAFLSAVESVDREVEVVSVGRRLDVIKQVGSPANLERTYSISKMRGSHGLGHTRLSTESIVDLSHSQPFWSHGFPDLAIVHNGHITNYHQLRRRYEQRHVRFYTENDSEIIAIYLAERLCRGSGLHEALTEMLRDLDGSFSCLAATGEEFGFVKDPFSLKPLVFTESDRYVAAATEEIAIRSALCGDYEVRETQAREVRVWRR